MSSLIMLLIAVAMAFPAGWLLCRAWMNATGESSGDNISRDKHHALLQAQRSRYRKQVQRVIERLRKHESARDQLREKLSAIDEQTSTQQQQNEDLRLSLDESRQAEDVARESLAGVQAQADAGQEQTKKLQHELSLLQIERDELAAQAGRRETDTRSMKVPAISDTKQAASRAERGELREKLATAAHRQRELETRLKDRDVRIDELQQTVESWKHRVAPLARQINSYRQAIKKLQRGDQVEPAQIPAPDSEQSRDPLQRIRGIGPALERRLNSHGIRTFPQLAVLDPVEIAALADKLAIAPSLPKRDEWIKQARELATNDCSATTA
ncbi:MAG: helix-hairpin-helix domain-containing protein [Gammaproteobacteria bacterium]